MEKNTHQFGSLELPLRKCEVRSTKCERKRGGEARRRYKPNRKASGLTFEQKMIQAQEIITGAKILAFLEEYGWNQGKLSYEAGVHDTTLSHIINERKPLRFARQRVAKVIKELRTNN
jgi:hypothetical protein